MIVDNVFMDFEKIIQEANVLYEKERLSFTKKDYAFLLNRETLKNRLLGFLTLNYYKRKKVFENGKVSFGYVFQQWDFHKGSYEHPIWILHSPSLKVEKNPSMYEEICKKIRDLQGKYDFLDKKTKEFLHLINEPLSRVSSYLLPESFYLDVPIYLTITEWIIAHISTLHLGLNLILSAPSSSKEIFLLPEKYFPSSWGERYFKEGFLFDK